MSMFNIIERKNCGIMVTWGCRQLPGERRGMSNQATTPWLEDWFRGGVGWGGVGGGGHHVFFFPLSLFLFSSLSRGLGGREGHVRLKNFLFTYGIGASKERTRWGQTNPFMSERRICCAVLKRRPGELELLEYSNLIKFKVFYEKEALFEAQESVIVFD